MYKYITSIVFLLTALCSRVEAYTYPCAEKCVHIDVYGDVTIPDPYHWLEHAEDPKTQVWIKAQNHLTTTLLSQIPYRESIKKRLTELMNYEKYSAPIQTGKHLLFRKNDGLQNQSIIYIQKYKEDLPRVFLDPNTLSENGTVFVQALFPSKNGEYVAFSLCAAGSDRETIRIMDVESLTVFPEVLEEMKFSDITWKGDGFYYNRQIEKNGTSYWAIYFHVVGDPQKNDKLVFEKPEHPQHFYKTQILQDERYLFLYAWPGSSDSENAVWMKDLSLPDSPFVPLFPEFKHHYHILDIIGDRVLVQTNCRASNQRLVLVDLHNPSEEHWTELIPEKTDLLEWAQIAGGKLFINYLKNATNYLSQYDLQGHFEKTLTLPDCVCIKHFQGKPTEDTAFFSVTSYTTPSVVYQYNITTGKAEFWKPIALSFDPSLFTTKQIFFSSKDGTQIPLFIVHKKGLVPDESTLALLYGYGGFGVCMAPRFDAARILFLEQNGVLAVPIIRGGGEFGKDWHHGGMLLNKQNGFDDFIAAAEYLIHNRYTSAKRLTIHGISNGGLLVGACMTQRPELFKVAIPEVGVLDMLRYQLFTVGKFWIPEYGCSDDPLHFQNLLRYSPLHNVEDGVDYPATLVLTGDHDDRVVPAHSYKFAATLQAKSSSKNPVLLLVEQDAGHGLGKPLSKMIEQQTDMYTFIFWQIRQ